MRRMTMAITKIRLTMAVPISNVGDDDDDYDRNVASAAFADDACGGGGEDSFSGRTRCLP